MLNARPMSYTEPTFATPIVVRATEVERGWQLPDEVEAKADDDDGCIALDESDILEVEPA